MKKKRGPVIRLLALLTALYIFGGINPLPVQAGREIALQKNPYTSFSVPTQISYYDGRFFLADCYHNQMLTSKEAGLPPSQWEVMDAEFNGPHAIAYDGELYVVVDTENNRIVTYKKTWNGFEQLQVIPDVGNRPHYVSYQADEGLFYVWSSLSGEMYLFRRFPIPGSMLLYLEQVKAVPELQGKYVRSFTIEGDRVYLPCVNLKCIVAVDKESFEIKDIYPVPDAIAGIVQITRIENLYYITVLTDSLDDQSKACFIRTPSLALLSDPAGGYEVITDKVGGMPYYLTKIGGSWYGPIPREDGRSAIVRFDVIADQIVNVKEYSY